ncbi:hypothetical protein HOLleu_10610 [Holothuria leucospilota]|uniref:Uncharacterized protein n=1 Tax=Holothuria leucospilota TaxID=206669 RepID=A0A9Q1HFU6_HOLLE|nr:hypothetical protein HOLleu_10610 [Holothuria leucospilota]
MREICSRVQGEDESIADFYFALIGLADKLSNIPGSPNAEEAIKDQFRDGLLDGMLRREVKRLLKEEPRTPFITVRDWALDMADLEFNMPKRKRKTATHSVEVPESQTVSALDNLSIR